VTIGFAEGADTVLRNGNASKFDKWFRIGPCAAGDTVSYLVSHCVTVLG
jgi:hypothetical protein